MYVTNIVRHILVVMFNIILVMKGSIEKWMRLMATTCMSVSVSIAQLFPLNVTGVLHTPRAVNMLLSSPESLNNVNICCSFFTSNEKYNINC